MTLAERFHTKYVPEPNSGCWLWDGCQNPNGYGMIRGSDRPDWAHRVSWALHFGPIPKETDVCHKCDVRSCVNPDHLFLGTRSENMQDAKRKGRLVQGRVYRGEESQNARVSEATILVIRKRLKEGAKGADLAKEFGLSTTQISRIRNKQVWKHV